MACITIAPTLLYADTTETAHRGFIAFINKILNQDGKTDSTKKMKFGIICGPHYSSDTKFGIGFNVVGEYFVKRDGKTSMSNLTIFGDITTTKYFNAGIRGNNFFKEDRVRIDYKAMFDAFPSKFWGLGYSNNDNDKIESKYRRLKIGSNIDLFFSTIPNLYIGPHLEHIFIRAKEFEDETLISGRRKIIRPFGLGFSICWDSRDFLLNPQKGTYAKISFTSYYEHNHKSYYKINTTVNYFTPIWKDGVLGFDFNLETNWGRTPWLLYSELGGSYKMRGYYEGRYRDRNAYCITAELRQKVYRRHGVVAWAGMGTVWGIDNFNIKNTLPNWGVGYRFELIKKINIRLDFGFGKNGQHAIIFQIAEAF